MHSLLERQLRQAGFNREQLPTDVSKWQAFLDRIARFYSNAEKDRQLYEHNNINTVSDFEKLLSFRNIFAALPDGVCIFDIKGHLIFCNKAVENHLDATQSELQKESLLERFELHEKVNPDVRFSSSHLLQRLREGYSFEDHRAKLIKNHNTLPVCCKFNPIIDETDSIIGIVLIFGDMTEMTAIQNDLITAKEVAEKASHAKSQFLSSMSHELRTPMNAILGYSELLKEDLGAPLDEFDEEYVDELQLYVNNILQASWHLLDLINKVLDLTRIEAGKLEVSIEKVELIDLIKECVSLVSPLAEKRTITIYNETEINSLHYALADRARLKQVIINLLSNAVKYNKEKGEIFIRLYQPKLEYIHLEVEDTGIGLTITKRLLEIMDGKIGVNSLQGKGSTFYIELPTGEVGDCVEKMPDSMRRYILLYIEDSRTNVSLVAQILKARPNIALMSANTGEMGLKLAHMHRPDIILLDINLPGIDGYEVLAQLKTHENTKDIPVLGLSAMDTVSSVEKGKEADFLTYIVKPLDIKKFLAAVDMALEQSLKT